MIIPGTNEYIPGSNEYVPSYQVERLFARLSAAGQLFVREVRIDLRRHARGEPPPMPEDEDEQ